MDWEYMGGLLLSMLIFAPGVFILALALVVGILMAFEKTGVFARMSGRHDVLVAGAWTANPPAGEIVSRLKRDLEGRQEGEKKRAVS